MGPMERSRVADVTERRSAAWPSYRHVPPALRRVHLVRTSPMGKPRLDPCLEMCMNTSGTDRAVATMNQ